MAQENTRKDHDPSVIIMRKFANVIANVLAKTRITPNQITTWNFIIFVPLILYFFIRGTYADNFIALGLTMITIILDLCDGIVARLNSVSSKYGAWLDASLDTIFQGTLFVAISVGVFRNSGDAIWLILGLIVIFGQNMANVLGACFDKEFSFDAYCGNKEFNEKYQQKNNISAIDTFLKNIIVPCDFIYIFAFTARYLLVIGIIINHLNWFLLAFAIMINLRWIFLYIIYFIYLKGGESRMQTILFLRELRSKMSDNRPPELLINRQNPKE